MRPVDVIQEARVLLNDTRPSSYRYSLEDMLRFYNDATKRILMLRPDIFSDYLSFQVQEEVFAAELGTNQTVYAVLDMVGSAYSFQSVTGPYVALEEVPYDEFTRAKRLWVSDTPGLPTKYARDPNNRRLVYLNPRPDQNVLVWATVARRSELATSANMNQNPDGNNMFVSGMYTPALVDAIVFMAQSIDDEHVNSNRARMFYESFINLLGVSERNADSRTAPAPDTLREMRNDPQ